MSFLLTAIIDGEDAVSLDVSPSSIVWNQEGDVSVDAQGNTVDNSSWPVQYITASVRKGDTDESGWLYGFTIGSGCSFTVRKGTLSADGKFTVDTNGHTFELSSPRKTKDASGKEAENLWTNGSLRITATKNGMKITKDAGIILNALATWKLSVINGTATATSKKVEPLDDKIKTMQSEIQQNYNEISLKVSTMTSGRNMWINGDFEMNPSMAPAYVHNTDGNTTVSDRIDSVDLPAGFTKRLVFNCPKTSYGIYYKTQKNITPSTLNSSNAFCLSFFAKATKTCEMTAGLEGIATGTVALTGQWKRYAIYIQKGIDYTKWNGSIIFYPASAIGADQYVCITGIQMETGSEADGAPSVWAKSTDDIKQTTGIDITNGGIEAIAGKFDFVGKDGNPYIRCEQDADGYPHFVFYIPGHPDVPAYDLGSTGLEQIVASSHKLEFPLVLLSSTTSDGKERKASGYFYVGKIDWSTTNVINAWDLCYEYYQTRDLAMYKFLPAYFVNKAGTKIYVPTSAQALENKMYWTQYTSDGLPLGDAVEDGWYLLVTASQAMNSGRVREYLPNGLAIVNQGAKTQNYVDYLAIGIKGGKILSQSIAFRVETWPTQGSLLVGQVQSGNLSLRLSFLDDTEDSDQIAYDTSAGTLTFKSPVVKQG